MIYGKKNYLPPMPLEIGFGVMFRLDDGSVGRHLSDRKERNYDMDMETMSVMTEAFDRYNLECSAVVSTGGGGAVAAEGEEDEEDEAEDTEPKVSEDTKALTDAAVVAKEESDEAAEEDDENTKD